MLFLPELSTRRLRVKLQECAIGNAIECALMPETAQHACDTAYLQACITDGGGVPDPRMWTVQERALAVGHYLIAVHQRDFEVGANGRYSDYLDAQTDIPGDSDKSPLELGEIEGDKWCMHHLYGYMAEAIERLQGVVRVPNGDAYLHWRFGCMAAQMVRDAEEVPDWSNSGVYDDYLAQRMQVLMQMPESAMAKMMQLYEDGRSELYHLFDMCFDKNGIAFRARADGKGAEAALPPATFPSRSCISKLARQLAGKS